MKTKWNNNNLREYIESNSNCKYDGFYKVKSGHIMLKLVDENGHIFETQKKHFDNGKHSCNDCTGVNRWNDSNLKEYIENNSKCKYKKFKRKNSNLILYLKCECGNEFKTKKGNFDKGKKQCAVCSGFSKNARTISLAEYCLDSLKLWDYDKNKNITPYDVSHASNKKYWFKCPEGKHDSELKAVNWFSKGSRCNACAKEQLESIMATVLKIEFKNNFPNTIWEYKANCIGLKGYEYPYDIYVPELNLLIECQSEYHDNEYQKKKDKIKKEFALNNGYSFLEFDSRYDKLEDLLPMLFNKNYNKNNYDVKNIKTQVNWDIKFAQKLLNETDMTYEEIAKKVGTTKSTISNAAYRKVLNKQKNRKKKKTIGLKPIYRIGLDFSNPTKYNSIREAEAIAKVDNRNISACARGKINSCGNSKWLYEEDYFYILENNINIDDIRNFLKSKY